MSRRVISLTRGYASGLLTFNYPNPLSQVRENYLVNYLDQVEISEVLKTKALITANLISIPKIAKEANKESFDIFKAYADLLLPSPAKSAKMKEMTREERLKVKERLAEFKKTAIANLPKPKPRRNRPK